MVHAQLLEIGEPGTVCIQYQYTQQSQGLNGSDQIFNCSSCPSEENILQQNTQYLSLFVEQSSEKLLELGTIKYPYKSMHSPLIELFNNLPIEDYDSEILIKQNTTLTYQDEKIRENGQISTLEIRNLQHYQEQNNTLFNFMHNQTYNQIESADPQELQDLETLKRKTSVNFFIIKSNFTISNLIIKNEIDWQNENKMMFYAWDIQYRSIVFKDLQIEIYGGFFQTPSPLNLLVQNVSMKSDWLNQAFQVNTDCTLTQNYSTKGDIVIKNFTIQGEKYLMINQPMIYILTINNVTIDRSHFGIYARKTDGNYNQLYIDSSDSCIVNDNSDGTYKKVTFTNNYITSNPQSLDNIVVLYQIILNNAGDKIRPLYSTLENITAYNIYTNTDFMRINGFNIDFTIKNLHFKNVNILAQNTFTINATNYQQMNIYSKLIYSINVLFRFYI
eukprot:403344139